MRAYVAMTGATFLLLALVHAARLLAEVTAPLRNPVFLLTTIALLAFVVWAVAVWKGLGRSV